MWSEVKNLFGVILLESHQSRDNDAGKADLGLGRETLQVNQLWWQRA